MTNSFQFEAISKQVKNYIFAILFSTKKKNCSAMSKEIGISNKRLYEVYKKSENYTKQVEQSLINIVKKYSNRSLPSVLIIDPTTIRKWFANDIDSLAYDYDGVIHKSKKCLVPIVAAWTNSKITIPLDFSFWTNSWLTKIYKKKTELAQELIVNLRKLIEFDYVALDGAFASKDMIDFFMKNLINFCMRIARNRVIISEKGIQAQLQNHPELKLKKNECYKTIKGTYKGLNCFFTAHKRYDVNKKSYQIVFIVSSLNISPKEQANAYGIRWNIEKTFRTMKQSLGLNDCQCLSLEKQRIHILSVFLAYAKLEEQKICNKKKSPEEILKEIRPQKNCKCHQTRPMNLRKRYVEI